MIHSHTAMRSFNFFLLTSLSLAGRDRQDTPYSSATISGPPPARIIGSATTEHVAVTSMPQPVNPPANSRSLSAQPAAVWKSEDSGTITARFDEQPVQSIGAIALAKNSRTSAPNKAPANPGCNSISISGLRHPTNRLTAARAWNKARIASNRNISLRSSLVRKQRHGLRGGPGARFGADSPDRGLYKTTDGGRHGT